jgi:hypothetical protein
LAVGSPPDLVLNRHCGECEFRDVCRQKAVEKDDLSLLGNMSAKERDELRGKGIFTLTQLSYMFRPRRRPKRLRDKREKYHHSLKALAIREKKIHIVGSPELKLVGTPVYLDVEGLPDRAFYYLVGVRVGSGKAAIQHSLWADGPDDERVVWRQFLDIVGRVDKPLLVHFGSYETAFLKRLGDRHGNPSAESTAGMAIRSALNLLSFIFAQIYFPTYSNGLKEIAGWLGYRYSEKDASGARSIEWRQSWEQLRDAASRQRLVTYNAEDCAALALVAEALASIAGYARPAGEHADKLEVVLTARMKDSRDSKWREFTSTVEELVSITEAAHWDYQRERVYFRSPGAARRARKKRPATPDDLWRLDKTVEISPTLLCPKCMRAGEDKGPTRSRTVQELVFGRASVKRRVVRYVYQPRWCSSCGLIFGVEPSLMMRGKHRRYGRSLIAYVFYHAIELFVPVRVVGLGLGRMFGLTLNSGTYAYFKKQLSDYYAATYQQILQRIVAGSVVHADETNANVKGKRAYVWVFTSMREVAYVYSDNREATVAQETLGGMKGVLVSDFYAAYDGLNCPQQKCLIHLARDLNGQLLDHPFDEELKRMVRGFGVLVKTIVDGVDRHGLKRRFLTKYARLVKRFYRELVDVEYRSTAANTCKDRFQKNRDRLFTFLRHDGVPWNNNNAEHAIKAFAMLREVIGGGSNETGIRDYLVLLSVCQTCKYQGVDFLDFLRSGETDISVFAQKKSRRQNASVAQPF